MALNKARIRVAQMARVYLAPVGTPAPTDATVAMPTAWAEVGYFTPDSLQWTTAPTFQEVKSHQSNYPTRRFQDGDAADITVVLQEWSAANFQAVYGGGGVTTIAGTPNQYKFSPPQIGGRTQVAAVVEIVDGAIHFRKVIPCAQQIEGVTTSYERAKEANLPLKLAVIGSDLGDPWYDLTDDPAFAPVP